MGIVINVKGCEFECTESYYFTIYELRSVMSNFRHCVKKKNSTIITYNVLAKFQTSLCITQWEFKVMCPIHIIPHIYAE